MQRANNTKSGPIVATRKRGIKVSDVKKKQPRFKKPKKTKKERQRQREKEQQDALEETMADEDDKLLRTMKFLWPDARRNNTQGWVVVTFCLFLFLATVAVYLGRWLPDLLSFLAGYFMTISCGLVLVVMNYSMLITSYFSSEEDADEARQEVTTHNIEYWPPVMKEEWVIEQQQHETLVVLSTKCINSIGVHEHVAGRAGTLRRGDV